MLIIRKATKDDLESKGYVHYQSWNETYTGLINQEYLDKRSLEKCVEIAKKYFENTYVAEVDGNIVGFACYDEYRGKDLNNAGEVTAIYILKDYQKMNIGRKLMDACLYKLSSFEKIVVWVLSSNQNAIDFYSNYGFIFDGITKEVNLSDTTKIIELRMIKSNSFN